MVKYILTTNELDIVTMDDTPWDTPGEYQNDVFKIIICEVPEGKEVDFIRDPFTAKSTDEVSGEVSPPEYFNVQGKRIACNHIYRNADVKFKDIPQPEEII